MKSIRCQLLTVFLLSGLLLFGLQTVAFAAKAPTTPSVVPAVAAPTTVVPIEIRAHAYDAIGTALIQRTTDIFASDNRFRLSGNSEPARVIINVSTQASKSNKEPLTAYGLAVTFKLPSSVDRIFAGNTVGVCSMKEMPSDAQGIVDMTWSLVENFPDLLAKVVKPAK